MAELQAAWTPSVALRYNTPTGDNRMAERVDYHYRKPKPGSNYRQLFVNT